MTSMEGGSGAAGSAENQQRLPAQAFRRLLPRIRALAPADYARLNVDVQRATSRVTAHMPRVRAVRPQIEATVKLSLEEYDLLEDYTLALSHAHTLYMIVASPRTLEQLIEEGSAAREVLIRDAQAAIGRRFLSEAALAKITGYVAPEVVYSELFALAEIFRSNWSRLEGKTGTSFDELQNADVLALSLMEKLGGNEPKGESEKQAAADRLAAFTLFARSHRFARHLILFARRDQGDADDILPPLYGPQKGRKKVDAEEPEEDDDSPSTTAPQANASDATAPPATASGAAASSATGSAMAKPPSMLVGEVLKPGEPGETGMPGVDPFKD